MDKVKYVAGEFLASFIFSGIVFSSVINAKLSDAIGASAVTVGASLAFISTAIIYAFMDITAAHFNPAITFAAVITGKLEIGKGLQLILAQFIGGVAGLLAALLSFPGKNLKDLVLHKSNEHPVFTAEVILTFIMVYIVFALVLNVKESPTLVRVEVPDRAVSAPSLENLEEGNLAVYTTLGSGTAGFAPLAIGLTIGCLAMVGSSSSGGVFNPILAFAPSLLSGDWSDSYKYFAGEFVGASIAALLHKFVMGRPVVNDG